MCGLAGVILNKNKNRPYSDLSQVVDIFEQTLINAEERGKHAAGYVVTSEDSFLLYKRIGTATNLIKSNKHNQLMFDIENNTNAIIGHTRYATQGSPKNNRNNHPIRCGNIIGTHNGALWNDTELSHKFDLSTESQVDSEVLFRLLDKSDSIDDFVDSKLPLANGNLSLVWTDLDEPNIIYLIKGNKPLEMVFLPKQQAIIYASHLHYITDHIDVKYEIINTKENTLYRIDTNGFDIQAFKVKFKSKRPIKNYSIGGFQTPIDYKYYQKGDDKWGIN